MEKNKTDSCSTVMAKKLVILKVIDDIGGKNEVWVRDLANKISKLTPHIKNQFGLNYKENSIYKSLDGMASQRLILKYQKNKSDVRKYVKITKLGLDVIKDFEDIFNPNKK